MPFTLAGVRVGLLGATSPVGQRLVAHLTAAGAEVLAYDRQRAARELQPLAAKGADASPPRPANVPGELAKGPQAQLPSASAVPLWLSAAPLWVLPPLLPALAARGAKRLVALSSTSLLTKAASPDPAERAVAAQLVQAETAVTAWAEAHGVAWTLLRPTLIYGEGRDQNVTVIARFLSRWGFWPLVGGGRGLRQPIHVADVAAAVTIALAQTATHGQIVTITGGETLTYRAMVERIAAALRVTPRFLPLPDAPLRAVAPLWPRLARHLRGLPLQTLGMLTRMAVDQAFDGRPALALLPGWQPRPFQLTIADLPPECGAHRWKNS